MNFKLTTDKRLIIAIALLLLSAVIVIAVSVFQTKQVNESAKMVAHTQAVLSQSEKLVALIADNESAVREYVLTGQGGYLASAQASTKEMGSSFLALKKITASNILQQQRIDSLSGYITKRIAFLKLLQELRNQQNTASAMQLIDTGRDRLYNNTAKTLIGNIQAFENSLLEQHRKINDDNNTDITDILLLVIICILILLAFFIRKIRLDFFDKKTTASTLAELNNKLEQKVKERTSELEQSKTSLEETFLRITDAFLALDKNWRYTYVNKQLGELVHRRPEDLVGKNVWEEFPAAVGSATYDIFFKAMKEQRYMWNEDYFEGLDLWQENHVYPSPDGISVYIRDITEKKKREKELEEINNRYLYVTKATSDAIWDWDLAKGTLYWGQGFRNMFGYNLAELQPDINTWAAHLHGDDVERIKKSLDTIISGSTINWNEEYRFLKADGTYAYIIDRGFVLRDANGRALRMIGAMQDITGTKIKEQALQAVYNERNDILESIGDSFFALDKHWIVTYWNKKAEKLLNRSRSEVLGKNFWEIYPDEVGRDFYTQYQKVVTENKARYFQTYWAAANAWLEVSAYPSGKGIAVYFKDITESKRINSQLEESEKRFSTLFEMSPQPMWVFNPATLRFIQVNKAAVDKYGYSEAEFMQMTIMDIRQEEDVEQLQAALSRRDLSATSFSGLFRHQKKSGELMDVEVYGSPIVINDLIYRSVIAIDVTDRIRFENQITRAIIKAQEDERYEIGGELHDNVCQLLATSQLTLGMVKDHLPPDAEAFFKQARTYITQALEEIRNLSHRLAPAAFTDTPFEKSLEILLQDFNIAGKYSVSLHFDKAVHRYAVSQEIQLNLYRILQEELRNILKYAKATEINVRIEIKQDCIVMNITDNGIGFNMQATNSSKGIGLANMKRRAELFSGQLKIDSHPGQGCSITVSIPVQQGESCPL